jgi:hypothetical protein
MLDNSFWELEVVDKIYIAQLRVSSLKSSLSHAHLCAFNNACFEVFKFSTFLQGFPLKILLPLHLYSDHWLTYAGPGNTDAEQ